MEVVIEQSKLDEARVTYQAEVPLRLRCRKCKGEGEAVLIMQVHDNEANIRGERPEGVRVWPHDALVINIYLCTNCGAMRATWNQG